MAGNQNKRTKIGEGYAVVLYHDRESDVDEFNPDALERAVIDVLKVTPKRASEIVIDTFTRGQRVIAITTRKNAAHMIMGFESHDIEAGIVQM